VKQIGKLLSFVLFLHHHDAVLNETKRKINLITIRNGEESETSDKMVAQHKQGRQTVFMPSVPPIHWYLKPPFVTPMRSKPRY
jgi:hypothetical protein